MTEQDVQFQRGRFLASGDESGTAPEDRAFRPDVEGLRAIAVLLVVLYHSGISALSGGYIGVDVFFVISGFVITGVLLRERSTTGRTSILAFYGRRCRRIIPAATLVIIVTVALSYYFLGIGAGDRTAVDGRWAAVFLANFHFGAIGTNYLSAQQPPSPLQNYWSLSVEEQFYVVYPTLFLLLAGIRSRLSLRMRLAIGLVTIIGASLVYSVVDTQNNATAAYFSPLTRAWELALGALVALGTPWLRTVPTYIAATATWLGLGAVFFAAFTFSPETAYPGSLVAIPVVGAALIIAGGVKARRLGVESLLQLPPLRGLGKLSYSLYLWHWPILIIAAEYANRTSLSVAQNLGWDLVALFASVVSYVLIENPIRHAKILFRIRWASIGLGAALVTVSLGALTLQSDVATDSSLSLGKAVQSVVPASDNGPRAPLQTVQRLVAAASKIRTVPPNLIPPLSQDVTEADSLSKLGIPPVSTGCWPSNSQNSVPACVFGDRQGKQTMVLYGDSHAGMWFKALDDIAKRAHWRLDVLTHGDCPASIIPVATPGIGGEWDICDQWHRFAISRINRIDPTLLIVGQTPALSPNDIEYSPSQWRRGLARLFGAITAPKMVKVVIGNIPLSAGPECVVRHINDIQACAVNPYLVQLYNKAERLAVESAGGRYISVIPWFCVKTCSPIIGQYDVYFAFDHVSLGYSLYLEGVLAQALDLQSFKPSTPRH
jgi:peptidoglycan/LPS O-acetylase OafA/YrhL